MKPTILVLFLFIATGNFSQSPLKAELNPKGFATIEFNAPQEIKNVLVIITGTTGETVFFEQLEKFEGNYSRTINLKAIGPDTYTLKILRDEIIFSSILTVK